MVSIWTSISFESHTLFQIGGVVAKITDIIFNEEGVPEISEQTFIFGTLFLSIIIHYNLT